MRSYGASAASNEGDARTLPAVVLGVVMLFGVGVCASGTSALALAFPGSELRYVWRFNPDAGPALTALGSAGIALMGAVCLACIVADVGLLLRKWWGHRLSVGILAINAVGDVANIIVRGDWHTLVGVPIALALIAAFLRPRVLGIYERQSAA